MASDSNEPPGTSAVKSIAHGELRSPELVAVQTIWSSRAGAAGVPTRDALLPRPLAPYLRHISLVRWMAEERDYEFRFVGDAHVQAYGFASDPGYRLGTFETAEPGFAAFIRSAYDRTRTRRTPLAYRGIIGHDFPHSRFTWFETLYLPLRGRSDAVDYVLNASMYAPRGGAWPSVSPTPSTG